MTILSVTCSSTCKPPSDHDLSDSPAVRRLSKMLEGSGQLARQDVVGKFLFGPAPARFPHPAGQDGGCQHPSKGFGDLSDLRCLLPRPVAPPIGPTRSLHHDAGLAVAHGFS